MIHRKMQESEFVVVHIGGVMSDKTAKGKERPWVKHREKNTYLTEAYVSVDERKAELLSRCGNVLTFRRLEDNSLKLHNAYLCKVRLCQICAWRRSLKIYGNMSRIMDYMQKNGKFRYVFLTLTVQNSELDNVSQTIDEMMAGWTRLSRSAKFKQAVKGWYRGLEITHNLDRASEWFNTYHLHFHCVLAVKPSYFDGNYYIKQSEWLAMWQKAMRTSYVPGVDVRTVKGNIAKAVAEIAKYTVKPEDVIIMEDWDLTVETVGVLDAALANRRLVGYGGVMKEVRHKLQLGDEVDGDLIHVDEEKDGEDDKLRLETYAWNTGLRQYIRVE